MHIAQRGRTGLLDKLGVARKGGVVKELLARGICRSTSCSTFTGLHIFASCRSLEVSARDQSTQCLQAVAILSLNITLYCKVLHLT